MVLFIDLVLVKPQVRAFEISLFYIHGYSGHCGVMWRIRRGEDVTRRGQ